MNLLPAESYSDIYHIIVLVMSFIAFLQYRGKSGVSAPIGNTTVGFTGVIIVLFFILFIGTRPISEVFLDMTQYYGIYNRWDSAEHFSFDWGVSNLIYDNLMRFLASISFPPILFYILIATIYFGGIFIACKKLFPNDTVAAFLVCVGAFSTFAAGTNGIKAGAAASLFLIALAYRDKLIVSFLFLLLSYGFHHSMMLPISAFLCASLIRELRYYFILWFFGLLMAILHVTYFQFLFAGLTDEHGAEYLLAAGSYWGGKSTGFRLDFVIYSAMPIVMGWYSVFKRKIKNRMYEFLLSAYVFTNAIWLLCMYAIFTNRIAYLSWFMYPVVLVYPCLLPEFGEDRFLFFSRVATLHLAFTLFMVFIYY